MPSIFFFLPILPLFPPTSHIENPPQIHTNFIFRLQGIKNVGLSQEIGALSGALLLTHCVMSRTSLDLSGPQFPICGMVQGWEGSSSTESLTRSTRPAMYAVNGEI